MATDTFFGPDFEALESTDPEIASVILAELERQRSGLQLIASENFTSPAVLATLGSTMSNKYAEGYPAKRYYGGCAEVDKAEVIGIERAKALFSADHANLQPHSGASANLAAYGAFVMPGDTVMAMSLAHGGHLTHGSKVNFSGKWFTIVPYGVRADTELIDYDEVRAIALEHRPKMIICGATAYPRLIDFAAFRAIADEVGAILMVDAAHFIGLVAGKAIPSPVPYADVVTSTTHKSLRGPRGGIILTNSEEMAKKINSAVFPGMQGGPLMHVIAGKATAFHEALQPAFKAYQQQVLLNADTLAKTLVERGLRIVSGRTESHVMLVDLRAKGITGKAAELALGQAHITCNKNGIPNDPEKPMVTSGIRLGTPAMTTRGFGQEQARMTAHLIADVLEAPDDAQHIAKVRTKVAELVAPFPVYGDSVLHP